MRATARWQCGCWGLNSSGQLGDGKQAANATSDHPVAVADLNDAEAIFAGGDATCARRKAGGLWCWGTFSERFPLDHAKPIIESRPVAIPGLPDAVDIAISEDKGGACARRASGEVLCWRAGQTPAVLAGLGKAEQVVAGMGHYCARLASGEVTCWGDNSSGVFGIPLSDQKNEYQSIPRLTHVVEIAAGSRHNCARRSGN